MPDRNFEISEYRYGFNGKENDNDISSDGYDYGARIYDGKIGRWFSRDPLEIKYPYASPYNFGLNSPIQAYDPDGRLVIFINGEVGEMGFIGKSNAKDRGNISYWSTQFADIVTKAFNDNKTKFVDGDKGVNAYTRYNRGYAFAKKNFKDIINGLARDENGKIIETIKVISHSKGAAYASGYISAFQEMRNSAEFKDLFAGEGGKVEMHIMLAPHQSCENGREPGSGWKEFQTSETVSVGISHDWDILSGDDLKGDVINIRTDNGATPIIGVGKAHTVDGFHQETERAIEQFKENKNSGQKNKYNGFKKAVDKGDKGNKVYDRKTGKYKG